MKSISTSAVFMMLFIFSVGLKLSNAACVDTCLSGNGECEAETCWCLAGKGADDCATACGGACADGEVCSGGSGTTSACVDCPTGTAACVNGGVCASKAGDALAYCRCAAGLTGDACETVDCSGTSPCLNGGTCNATPDPDTCTCAEGYTGQICDQDIDECLSDPCQNDGTCTDAVNGYTCTCPTDYTGVHCESGASRIATALSLMLAALFIFKSIN